MAVQVKTFEYDYTQESKELDKWIEKKIEDGWEFVCILPKNYSGMAYKFIGQVMFKKTV